MKKPLLMNSEKGLVIIASEDTLTVSGNAFNGRYYKTIELLHLLERRR